ncbi:MAG: membrane protein insertase YidC [Deltaproteobacteria bacterium]|nr:membrane protein insertase YidC [Deltaproteobacteria bacterium]
MDKRTFLAITICFLVFILWQKYYIEPHAPPPTRQESLKIEPVTSVKPEISVKKPEQKLEKSPEQLYKKAPTLSPQTLPKTAEVAAEAALTLQTQDGDIRLSNSNTTIQNWTLKKYKKNMSKDSLSIDLSSISLKEAQGEIAFDLQELAYVENILGTISQTKEGALWSYEDQNIKIIKEIKIGDNKSEISVKLDAVFKTKAPKHAFFSLTAQAPSPDPEEADRQLVYWSNKEITRIVSNKEAKLQETLTPAKWIGLTCRYFLLALLPQDGEIKAIIQPLENNKKRISLVYPIQGDHFATTYKMYFGPKEIQLLRSIDPTLDHTVDLGWFTFFAYPLLRIMQWLYEIFHNYGLSIIFLTILINILTYPLNYKSMKSMKEVAKIQPQLQKIKEKYKDDKEALNRETLSLMKTHGYNPMAGCLPILVQLPVFIALYRVLYSSIELYQAPFYLWIQDLSSKDPYYITPVILTVVMFVAQKLTPTTAPDPTQAKMMQFMPLIFGVFMLPLPSGLTIYMLVNSLSGIVRQLVLNKKLGITTNVQGAKT